MPFSTPENEAITRLETYNSSAYDASTNPYGLGGVGYKANPATAFEGNWRRTTVDMALVADAIARLAGEVADDAVATAADVIATAADAVATAADVVTTEAARDAAIAAANSLEFPFSVTAGTSTAYTINFTPDLTFGDGSTIRVSIHTASGDAPTLAVDGGSAHEIVAPGNRSLIAGELAQDYNFLLQYDSSLTKWVIMGGLNPATWQSNRNANGNSITNLRDTEDQILRKGTVTAVTDEFVHKFTRAERWHNIYPDLEAGTCDFTLKKNGTAIDFGAGPSTTVSATTTRTAVAVNHSGNAYIDFAIGDVLRITISNISSADTLTVDIDRTKNYA